MKVICEPDVDETQIKVVFEPDLVKIIHPNGRSIAVSVWKDAFVIESSTLGTNYMHLTHTSSKEFELRIDVGVYSQ